MRLAFMIICLAAIAITLVSLRGAEVAAQQDIQKLQRRLVLQRRELWRLDAALGELRSVNAVDVRAQEMNISLLEPGSEDDTEFLNYALGGETDFHTDSYLDRRPSGGGG